jgi:serine/threonine protein kinase
MSTMKDQSGAPRAMLRSAGAGSDGGAFVGRDNEGIDVIVHRLDTRVLRDARRRRRIDFRIALHTQAAREGQNLLLGIRRVALDATPALLVVERPHRSLGDLAPWSNVESARLGLRVLRDAARALAVVHAEGVAHGQLTIQGRAAVRLRDDDQVGIDALDLHTGVVADGEHRALLAAPLEDEHSVAADGFAFGGLCLLTAFGAEAAQYVTAPPSMQDARLHGALVGLVELVRQLRNDEPAWRPPLAEVADHLEMLRRSLEPASSSLASAATADPPRRAVDGGEDAAALPARIGRFRVDALLGAGSMGRVYRGFDLEHGNAVAIKVIAREGPITPRALQRFKKEARLLAEIESPSVARFLADGVDGDIRFLVTEFVDGVPLGSRLREDGPLPERDAVDLAIEVLRALADVHDHGIVHRDLKPDNMMLTSARGQKPQIKLIDFGVARHLDEQGSLAMTRQGAMMGTPLYMSPEQVRGGTVDQRSDLYAVGSILFELVAGRAPFAGLGASAVLASQLDKEPPLLSDVVTGVSSELTRVVARALQKDAGARFPQARAMIECLVPLSSDGRRQTKETPPASPATQRWVSTWTLQASPDRLWPLVSDTDRLNQAIGLQPVEGSIVSGSGGSMLQVRSSQAGVALAWSEQPYEWVQARWMSVRRDYVAGPLSSLRSRVELVPGEGGRGTQLTHTVEVEPRGLVGRALLSLEIGVRTRRALDRIYTRMDDLLSGRGTATAGDAFGPPPALEPAQETRLAAVERALIAEGVAVPVVERLGSWLRTAAPQEVARIRPLALARQLDLPETAVFDACLWAAHHGALTIAWDLLCPTCRAPATIVETLKAVNEHGHCSACELDLSLDLSASVELIFRAHPAFRDVDTKTYCLSSPAHTPHVFAQVRVPAGTVVPLSLALPPGRYRLTTRRAAWAHDFTVRPGAPPGSWRVPLSTGPATGTGRVVPTRQQEFLVDNDTDCDQLVRVERTTPRDDALPATRALATPLFRRLFPGELLAPGRLVRAGSVTFLLAELRAASTTPLATRYAAMRAIDEAVGRAGGAVVRLQGADGLLASFSSTLDAVAAAQALPAALQALPPGERTGPVAVAIHRGEAGAVALGDHLDFFGDAVDDVALLVRRARLGELVVSDAVRADVARTGLSFAAGPTTGPVAGPTAEATVPEFLGDDVFAPVHRAGLPGSQMQTMG